MNLQETAPDLIERGMIIIRVLNDLYYQMLDRICAIFGVVALAIAIYWPIVNIFIVEISYEYLSTVALGDFGTKNKIKKYFLRKKRAERRCKIRCDLQSCQNRRK